VWIRVQVEVSSGGSATSGWILLSLFPDTSLGIYTLGGIVGVFPLSLTPPYRIVAINSSSIQFSPYISLEVLLVDVDPESSVVHRNYYSYAVSGIQLKPRIFLPYLYGAVGIRNQGDVYFSGAGPIAVYNYWEEAWG